MEELFDYAMKLGVQVEFTDLKRRKRNGEYCHDRKLIRLQDGMTPRKTRHVFAHELGHATFEDELSIFPEVQQRLEDRADEWAAHFLMSIEEFKEAEERHGGHVPSMAVELYVLEKTVHAFKRTLTKIGDTVYVNSKQGAGQWSHKVQVA